MDGSAIPSQWGAIISELQLLVYFARVPLKTSTNEIFELVRERIPVQLGRSILRNYK